MPEPTDAEVRLQLYRDFVQTARPPSTSRIAEVMGAQVKHVRAAMERLAAAKAIVLQPESREILIAAPLSAVPTPFVVHARTQSFFGPCIWDALGIIAMLNIDAAVQTSCPCCGEGLKVQVCGNQVLPVGAIVHFATPAKHWWENVVFT